METARHGPGFNTEYSDNFSSEQFNNISQARISPGFLDGTDQMPPSGMEGYHDGTMNGDVAGPQYRGGGAPGPMQSLAGFRPDNSVFYSEQYPGIYRETEVRRDDRGKYLDHLKVTATKPYGRKLLYDQTHPESMFPSQWSSELADANGCYSFPTTTGLDPAIPWTKDMSWQVESEEGQWPTPLWKEWTEIALCPPYDGHDDQVQYSQYKTPVQPQYSSWCT